MTHPGSVVHATATLSELLTEHATRRPERIFLRIADQCIDYEDAEHRVASYAAGLARLGIGKGQRLVLLMDNSIEQVLLWLAANRIGAVNVPLNPALTPDLLARSVAMVRPTAAVVDERHRRSFETALAASGTSGLLVLTNRISEVFEESGPPDHLELSTLSVQPTPRAPAFPVLVPLEAATMLFTSGSTGVPKACVLSHHYLLRAGQIHAKYLGLREDDVLFTPFPLFHIDAATLTVGAALAVGACAALARRFSAARFWDEVRTCEATVFNFMGATANILWKQPSTPRDRDHRVRLAWGVPMPNCEPQWQARFGFPLVEVYGSTDAGLPAYQPLDQPRRAGSCGRVIPEYQVRIADESGRAVPAGTVGEILIRSAEPGLIMTEYFDMPEQTRAALRGGWFHSGDMGRLDAEGNLYFLSRGKEIIRRRGENIAASTVEAAVDAHPDVLESAAAPIPSELSDDDVRVFVVTRPGSSLSALEVFEHCTRTLSRHMVPRYVDLIDELPKTPTEKIQRFELASRPLTSETWDAERQPAGGTR